VRDLEFEGLADRHPQGPILRAVGQPQPELSDRDVDPAIVQIDALDGVALAALPVTRFEALRRAPRDGAEVGVVAGECLGQVLRAPEDEVVRRVQTRLRCQCVRGCGSGRPRTRCT
jgi:hypothetical protein